MTNIRYQIASTIIVGVARFIGGKKFFEQFHLALDQAVLYRTDNDLWESE